MERSQPSVSRRDFVKTAAATAAATGAFPYFARAADANAPIKVGLIGCGGRGTGAAHNALAADPNVKVVALADVFKDRVDGCRKDLASKSQIEEKNCFVGFDAYEKLLTVDLDYVMLATPPQYRPLHLEACIKAGRHVFMEKPVAVDPPGIRKIIEAGKAADAKGLSIVAGTQRRHQKGYVDTVKAIHDGAIGDVVSGQCYWNQGQLWYRKREQGWSDVEWMIRDWVNWAWQSGDHVVEQHVHNLDVLNWVIGTHVERVVAMGGRHRRVTGDQYDFFAADLFYPKNVHVLSMCRQISGCKDEVSERVIGSKGVSNCNGWISNQKFETKGGRDAYVQEHVDLIEAMRAGKPLNEAKNVAESTMTAIMIRMSAYTGKEVTWDEAMKSDLTLKAPDYELTDENVRNHIPVPGKA